ncbi:hypothetical protein ACCO45_009860 [Purpureocillium lilacinum]|uniref:Uncharacterized protein n=1 Tax=Purpureocillium lilacinum TaxID=33203 RepID=A0ACC4DK56_PURLI
MQRSAVQALMLLQEEVYTAWRNRRILTLVTFDAKGAYNGVRKERLIQRMRARGIPEDLLRWVEAFCPHRTATIHINGQTSEMQGLSQAGLPQGSPLSPILFLFFNADLVQQRIDRHGGAVAFVDDFTAWVTSTTAPGNRAGIEAIIEKALDWERRSGATFNVQKTAIIHFTRKPHKSDTQPFTIKGQLVYPKTSVKVLGVTMDAGLKYNEHMATAANKGLEAAMGLRRLRGVTPATARQLFASTVAPAVDYASNVWMHACKNKSASAINRVQRVGAQAIVGTYLTVATVVAEAEAHIASAQERFWKRAVKMWTDIHTLPITNPLRSATSCIRKFRRYHRSPFYQVATVLNEIPMEELETINPFTLAPWRRKAADDISDPWIPVDVTTHIPTQADVPIEEVQDSLLRTGNTSPGADNITVRLLQTAWPAIGKHVQRLYQGCLTIGYHPRRFKEAEVVMIEKPGKRDLSKPRAWRPISLLSCLGKGLERLIARRLAWASIHYGVLQPQQIGGLPKRSAVDLVAALIHDIEVALSRGMVATLVTMDVQGAFDTVMRNRLILRLRQQGWPLNLVEWAASFMQARSAAVRFQDITTPPSPLECGLAQGSPASPILFALTGNATRLVSTQIKHLVDRFDAVLRHAIRAALPIWKTTPIPALHREAGVPPASILLESQRIRFSARLKSLDVRHPLVARTSPKPARAYHSSIKRKFLVERRSQKTRLERTDALLPNCARPVLLPRQYSDSEASPLQTATKADTAEGFPEWLKSAVVGKLIVYSDGSQLPSGAVGYGFTVQRNEQPIAHGSGRLGPAEVFDAEAVGALEGLQAAIAAATNTTSIVVCIDNLAVATCLRGNPADSSQDAFTKFQDLAKAHGDFEVRWIPGHAGIPGNEEADGLAKAGCLLPEPPGAVPSLAHLRRLARQQPRDAFKAWWTTEAPESYRPLHLEGEAEFFSAQATSSAADHLRKITPASQSNESSPSHDSGFDLHPAVTPKRRRLEQSVIPKAKVRAIQELSVGFVVDSDVPFTIFEHSFLRSLFNQFDHELVLQIPWSGSSIARELQRLFDTKRDVIKAELRDALTTIHLSFDLWTSPNRFAIMAVFAHFIDRGARQQSRLLALRRQFGTHSGENLAASLVGIAQDWEYMYRQLDSSMRPADIKARRTRCHGHILNPVARAFLFGKDAESFELESEINCMRGLAEQDLSHWRAKGPIGKLHNIVKFIRSSPQRSEHFKRIAQQEEYEEYRLCEESTAELEVILNNETRWNSTS